MLLFSKQNVHSFAYAWGYAQAAHLLCFLTTLAFLWMLWQSPQWLSLAHIQLTLKNGEDISLGGTELAAPAADKRHIRIGREANHYWLENTSATKRVYLKSTTHSGLVREIALQQGDIIELGEQRLQLLQIAPLKLHALNTHNTPSTWQLRTEAWSPLRGVLTQENAVQANCWLHPPSHGEVAIKNLQHGLKHRFQEPRLSLGGSAACENHLALPQTDWDTAHMVYKHGQWYITLGASQSTTPIHILRGPTRLGLKNHKTRLNNGDQFVVGYSHFQFTHNDDSATLKPLSRSERATTAGLMGTWQEDSRWPLMPSPLAAMPSWVTLCGYAFFALLALKLTGYGQATAPNHYRECLTALALALQGFAVNYMCSHPATLFALTLVALWRVAKLNLLHASARQLRFWFLSLLCIGLLTQLQLSLGGANTYWFQFVCKSCVFVSACLWLLTAWYLVPEDEKMAFGLWLKSHGDKSSMVMAALVISTFSLLVLQLFTGDEGGLGIFQPVEIAKTTLALLAAHSLCHQLDQVNRDHYLPRWKSNVFYLAPIAMFILLFCVMLLQLNDNSPLLLMLFWLAGIISSFGVLRFRGFLSFACCATLPLLFAALLYANNAKELFAQLPFIPQSSRLAVWANPALHPHSGYQFQYGMDMIQRGGVLGEYLSNAGYNGAVMGLPAVQDDFMPSFFINQFGLAGTALLVLCQCMLCFCLFTHCWRLSRLQHDGDYMARNLRRGAVLFIGSGTALLLGHFFTSSASNFGILPVVGQPQPLLSAAGSNLVFFVVPLVFSAMLITSGED